MLRFLSSSKPYILLLIPLLLISLWSQSLFNPSSQNTSLVSMPLYSLVTEFVGTGIFANIFAVIIILIQSILITRQNLNHIYISKRTYLPSIIFILLSSSITVLQQLQPAILANFFILLATDKFFSINHNKKPFSFIFDTFFLISIASLFYLDIIFLTIVFWFGLIILQSLNWRNFAISIIGLVIPYILIYFFYALQFDFSYFVNIIFANLPMKQSIFNWNIKYLLFFSFLAGITIYSGFYLFYSNTIKKIIAKRFFYFFLLMSFSLMIMFVISQFKSINLLIVFAIPASYVLSNYLLSIKKTIIADILLSTLIFSIVMMLFTDFF